MMRLLLPGVGLVFISVGMAATGAGAASGFNVLFIAVDDLRPVLGCYGDTTAVSPNIDRLAERGMVFKRAYCQQAVCSPSRLSLLTGRRPDTIRVWDLRTHFRSAIPDVVTLPQLFKNHGYHTQSIGKIYHGNGEPAKDPPSWSVEPQYDVSRDPKGRYALRRNLNGSGLKRSATESADVAENVYIDGQVCDAAIDTLRQLKHMNDGIHRPSNRRGSVAGADSAKPQPFFLAVGFRKPHLPFCAPQKYWNFYDRAQIPMPVNGTHPRNAPELATRSWNELEGYTDIPKNGTIQSAKVQELRHGYYACVSYVDALVGRLLDELKNLELVENTIVVLWGDHGFHLGEQGLWTKANNFELATRVPLIVSVPGQRTTGASRGLVELVDIYPTLADICGLDAPDDVEGISFKPLLTQPDLRWKRAAFSQYPRSREDNRHQGHGDFMGYAVRTQRYRYVEWRQWESRIVVARELYDHHSDPLEMRNVALQTGYAAMRQEMAEILQRGWKAAVPNMQETGTKASR